MVAVSFVLSSDPVHEDTSYRELILISRCSHSPVLLNAFRRRTERARSRWTVAVSIKHRNPVLVHDFPDLSRKLIVARVPRDQFVGKHLTEAAPCFLLTVDDGVASLNELDKFTSEDIRVPAFVHVVDDGGRDKRALDRLVRVGCQRFQMCQGIREIGPVDN